MVIEYRGSRVDGDEYTVNYQDSCAAERNSNWRDAWEECRVQTAEGEGVKEKGRSTVLALSLLWDGMGWDRPWLLWRKWGNLVSRLLL